MFKGVKNNYALLYMKIKNNILDNQFSIEYIVITCKMDYLR